MPRSVSPERVARLQRRYLRRQGASRREIRRYQPILTAQIGAESNFTQGVGSPAGARDIAQFMPGTAPGYGVTLGDNRIKDDIRGQVRYMLPLLRRYGAEGALRGYNAGVGAIERSHGFSETNNYVRRVRSTADRYRGLGAGAEHEGARRRGGGSLAQRLSGAGFDPGQPAAAFAVQQGLVAPQSLVPSAGLQAPAHDARARLALPEAYREVQGGGGPAPRESLASALAAYAGREISFGGGEAPATRLRRQARERLGIGGLEGARTPEQLGNAIEEFAAKELGITGGSRDRTVASNRAAGGSATSDHLEEPGAFRGREGIDLPTTAAQGGWGKYRKTVRKLGGTPAADGFSEFTTRRGRKVFRVQVIFGDAHGHGDHIHVGFKRIR